MYRALTLLDKIDDIKGSLGKVAGYLKISLVKLKRELCKIYVNICTENCVLTYDNCVPFWSKVGKLGSSATALLYVFGLRKSIIINCETC